jgi:hypothetical protein
LSKESIEIVEIRHVSSDAGYISADLLYRCSQLRLTPSGYEDVCAFVYKLLRRGQTNAAIAASGERDFAAQFSIFHCVPFIFWFSRQQADLFHKRSF